ncbi:glucokinase [Candidatus Woesearchaeota archaeon]|nr:glucokinase [Candidatus Woesearchaeota archaeon]
MGKIALVADIGATNANFGIAKIGKKIEIILKQRYESRGDFVGLLNDFLNIARKNHLTPRIGCIAVAGPVINQRVEMVNTKMVVDAVEIKRKTQLKKVLLINDFEAIGYSLNGIGKRDIRVINRGKPMEKRPKAVIGAGTGLGKGILIYDNAKKAYIPHPSEGGHGDFPIMNEEELKLARFIGNGICYEDLVSGRGIESIYTFLKQAKHQKSNLSAQGISKTRKTDYCSRKAFDIFLKFYARCARNFALDVLPFGGLYIAGGIAIKNPDIFSRKFTNEFCNNAAFGRLLSAIPVYLITNYDISLKGAAFAIRDRVTLP